ncbi:MAG: VWA domain-containing protein [Planctomycetes bacterium]|nr:VWA domain-containing protein [Planctomycetota bacterium]
MSALAFAASDLVLERPVFAWGALALLVALLLFSLVRRPRHVAVASSALWEQALAGSPANRALPLVRTLRALLAGAALLLSGVLAAGPHERTRGPLAWMLIVDASPSMSAREADGRTRLELAIEAAERFAQSLPAHDRLELLLAGDPPRLLCAPGSPRAVVLESLRAMEIEAPEADLVGALEIAARAKLHPVVFGDGAGARGALPRGAGVRLFGVGEATANRGFVDFELESEWPAAPVIRWALETSGGANAPNELELVDPRGRVTKVAHYASSSRGSAELPHWGGGLWTLRCASPDALPFDDALRFHLDGLAPRAIALRPRPDRAVHPALAVAFELAAQTFEVPLRWLAADEAPGADEVLVQDGGAVREAELPAVGALLFGATLEPIVVADAASAVSDPPSASIVRVESDRPALRGLPLDRLRVRRASLRLAPDAAAESWIAGPDRPLLYSLRAGATRIIGTTFDLRESNAPAEPSFAVLVHRLLLELSQPEEPRPAFFHAGAAPAPWMRSATDLVAGGVLRERWPAPPLALPAILPREGLHELRGASIPIELLDAEASQIAPGWSPGWAGDEPERPAEAQPLGVLVAALLFLVLLLRAGIDLLVVA